MNELIVKKFASISIHLPPSGTIRESSFLNESSKVNESIRKRFESKNLARELHDTARAPGVNVAFDLLNK